MEATSISVSNSSDMQYINVGDFVEIRDTRTGHYSGSTVVPDMIGQVVKITGISGTTVTLEDKISLSHTGYTTYINVLDPVENSGVINVRVSASITAPRSDYSNIAIHHAVNCLVSGVLSILCDASHIEIERSSHIEIRGCSIKSGKSYEGNKGYGIVLRDRSTNVLIEDNNFEDCRHHITLGTSANRNVIAYNYTENVEWEDEDWPLADDIYHGHMGEINLHGNYAHRNLIEHNTSENITFDGHWDELFPQTSTQLTKNGPYNVLLRNNIRTHGGINHGIDIYAADWTFAIGNDVEIDDNGWYISGVVDQCGSNNVKNNFSQYQDGYQTFTQWYYSPVRNISPMPDMSYYYDSYSDTPAGYWAFGALMGYWYYDGSTWIGSANPMPSCINYIPAGTRFASSDKVLEEDIFLSGNISSPGILLSLHFNVNGVRMTWPSVSASSYDIYRRGGYTSDPEPDQQWHKVTTVYTTTYIDTDVSTLSGNERWQYMVVAKWNSPLAYMFSTKPLITGSSLWKSVDEIVVDESIPTEFGMGQNYPNPFNPSTKIKFGIVENGYVSLKVYDLLGREVSVLVSENLSPGSYDKEFNGTNLSSRVYIYKLTSGGQTISKKFNLVK